MSESLGIADPVELDHDAGVTSEPQIPAFPHQSLSKVRSTLRPRPRPSPSSAPPSVSRSLVLDPRKHWVRLQFIEGMVHRPGEGWTIFPADLLRCVRGAAVVYKNYAR